MRTLTTATPDDILVHGTWHREGESPKWMAERLFVFMSSIARVEPSVTWRANHWSWDGSKASLASLFAEHPYLAEDGSPSPSSGFENFCLTCRTQEASIAFSVWGGASIVGRNMPEHRFSISEFRGSSTDIKRLCIASLRAFAIAFDPMQIRMTTRTAYRKWKEWKRGSWSIGPGYEVWLNDLAGPVVTLPGEISTERLGNGTLFTLPDDWSSTQVVTAWDELLRVNGLSDADKTLVQPMEIQLPPDDDPGPIPDRVPVAGAPTTEEADPVTAEDYRRQITGWDATDEGAIPVYSVNSGTPAGLSVSYEGHTRRGSEGERYEVFLHSVFGIDHLATDPLSDLSVLTAAELLNIASWQLNALPDGAVLEWHSNTTPGATALRNLLITNGITTIRVRNTPAIGADDE